VVQTVSLRPFTVETLVRTRDIPCGICGGQHGTGTSFSMSYSGFPVNIIPPSLSILIYHLGDEQ
jgi:hypothetical protein